MVMMRRWRRRGRRKIINNNDFDDIKYNDDYDIYTNIWTTWSGPSLCKEKRLNL